MLIVQVRNIPINIPLWIQRAIYYLTIIWFCYLTNAIISKIAVCNSAKVLLSQKYSFTLMNLADHWIVTLQCKTRNLSSSDWADFAVGCVGLAPVWDWPPGRSCSVCTEIRVYVPSFCADLWFLVWVSKLPVVQVFLCSRCSALGHQTRKALALVLKLEWYPFQLTVYRLLNKNDGIH